MVSEVTRSVPPVGLFAGGTSISGGTLQPKITNNFEYESNTDKASYPDGLPPSFSTTNGMVQSLGITSVDVNRATFKSKVGGIAGTYVFVSRDTQPISWEITSPAQESGVSLSQYGITISGTPVPGEGFSIQYVQGSSASDYTVTLLNISRTFIVQNVANKFLVGDMNLIGYLGTLERYRKQLGGIRTFDQGFSDAIGGYPKGAILEYLQTEQSEGRTRYLLRKVLSLIDDNTYDFVSDPSLIDNEHWMYCDVLEEGIPTMPSTDFTPYIIAWGIYDANDQIDRSTSYTLTRDCYMSITTLMPTQQHGSMITHLRAMITVTSILNGRQTIMVSKIVDDDNPGNNQDITNMAACQVARRGTTIKVTLRGYHAGLIGVSVFAVPVKTTSVTRL